MADTETRTSQHIKLVTIVKVGIICVIGLIPIFCIIGALSYLGSNFVNTHFSLVAILWALGLGLSVVFFYISYCLSFYVF